MEGLNRMLRKALVTVVMSAALACVAQAQTAAPAAAQPAPTKFGFVDTLRIVSETEEGKVEIGKVQEYINKKQSEYDAKKGDLDKLSEQYQNQQRNLNPETRDEMEKAITTKDKDLKRFQEDTQADIDRQRDSILGKLGQKVQDVIDAFAKESGYAAIFVRAQAQAYVAPALDVTDEIIKRYNQKFPVTAAPAAK
jgi:outer membrane protein